MIKTPSLIAAYNFNGNANDESGGGANATIINATLVDTQYGQGYQFNGTSNYIRLTQTNYDYRKGITISCFINPLDITTNRYCNIYRKDQATRILLGFSEYGTFLKFGIYVYGNGYTEFNLNINYLDYVNKWNHIAAGYNNNYIYIYVNGVLKYSYNITGYCVAGNENSYAYIACNSGIVEFFKGKICKLNLYNKALSDTDIKRIHEGFSPLNG